MKLLENILVCLDFSPATESVVSTACAVAARFEARLQFLHVSQQMESDTSEQMSQIRAVESALSAYVERARAIGIDAVGLVEIGYPANKIREVAVVRDANVILIGDRGFSTPTGPVGMNVGRLLRMSQKPVWITRQSYQIPQTIVCPIDFSEAATRALKNAIHLARRFAAHLKVVYVLETTQRWFGASIFATEVPADVNSSIDSVKSLVAQMNTTGVEWTPVVEKGDVVAVIRSLVVEPQKTLVVMGNHGIQSFWGTMGSNIKRHTDDLPCDTIAMSSQGAIRVQIEDKLHTLGERFANAEQLLAEGFAAEAKSQLLLCTETDSSFTSAWRLLAVAHEHLGETQEAAIALDTAKQIDEFFWKRKVEAEVRQKHFSCLSD